MRLNALLIKRVSQVVYNALSSPKRHHCATPLVNCVHYGAVWALLCPKVAEIMEKNLETDNLEMRLQALENRIYGQRRSGAGKPAKVRPEYYIC